MRKFHPEPSQSVCTSVRFTHCLYAQCLQQKFSAPKPFLDAGYTTTNIGNADDIADADRIAAVELGVKIACGLEILYAEGSRTIEKANIDFASLDLGDVESVIGRLSHRWSVYLEALKARGYFGDLLEGSQAFNAKLESAKLAFVSQLDASELSSADDMSDVADDTSECVRAVRTIDRVLQIPHAVEDFSSSFDDVLPNDAEDWLNITPEHLEQLMQQHQQAAADLQNSSPDASEAQPSMNMDSIVKTMHDFVQNVSSHEGAELPGQEGDDTAQPLSSASSGLGGSAMLNLNPEKFFQFLNMQANLPDLNQAAEQRFQFGDDHDDSSDDEADALMKADLDFGSHENVSSADIQLDNLTESTKNEDDGPNMHELMDQMDHELGSSKVAKSFDSIFNNADDSSTAEVEREQNAKQPLDLDFNLVQNLLKSYTQQHGQAGPVSNLLGQMGIVLPDDHDDSDEN